MNKNVKNECVETRSFSFFANNSRSKQNLKNPAHPFVDIGCMGFLHYSVSSNYNKISP